MGPQTIFKSSLLSGSKLGCLYSKVEHEGSIGCKDRVKAPGESKSPLTIYKPLLYLGSKLGNGCTSKHKGTGKVVLTLTRRHYEVLRAILLALAEAVMGEEKGVKSSRGGKHGS